MRSPSLLMDLRRVGLGALTCFSFFACFPSVDHSDWVSPTRLSCDLLTNPFRTSFEGVRLPKRKEALVAFSRRLCERVEEDLLTGTENDQTEILVEHLRLMRKSLIGKAHLSKTVSFPEIVLMGIISDLSPWLLRFDASAPARAKTAQEKKAQEKKAQAKTAKIDDDIYWANPGSSQEELFHRFDVLAAEKGIDPDVRFVTLSSIEGAGSSVKVRVKDIRNKAPWNLKWGDEVHTDVVASRIFAALGFDTDHPYYFGRESLGLILPSKGTRSLQTLVSKIHNAFKINLSPYIARVYRIGPSQILASPELEAYFGQTVVTFKKCSMEPRPKTITRLGTALPHDPKNQKRKEVRSVLLAHAWIGNWDIKEDNTSLNLISRADGTSRLTATYHDLGASFGVVRNRFPPDLRSGLVNYYQWDAIDMEAKQQIRLTSAINEFGPSHRSIRYDDFTWMAERISRVSPGTLARILEFSGWPKPIKSLYLEKLLHRRAQILRRMNVSDPFAPRLIRSNLEISYRDQTVVRNGQLVSDVNLREHPEGFLSTRGRFRGYGF